MRLLKTFWKAIAAGIAIGMGASAYLLCGSRMLGAFMFTVGLFTICFLGLELYTGRIGYLLDMEHPTDCLIVWLGNFVGCVTSGLLLRYALPELSAIGAELTARKLELSLPRAAVLGLFCGVLMYIAVHNYKENPSMFGKCVGIFVCIPAFIFCGFEHCIANIVYFALGITSVSQLLPALYLTLTVSVGNAVGAVFFRKLSLAFQGQKKNDK